MDLEQFWRQLPQGAALQDLSLEEAEAVFRLMMIGTFADDRVTQDERMALAKSVIELPFFEEDQSVIFDTQEGIQVMANLHDRFKDPKDFPKLMGEIRDALPEEKHRKLALQMMAQLVQTDGFEDEEYDFCLMVGQALRLPEDQVSKIIEDAWDIARD